MTLLLHHGVDGKKARPARLTAPVHELYRLVGVAGLPAAILRKSLAISVNWIARRRECDIISVLPSRARLLPLQGGGLGWGSATSNGGC
jgi:hypothetical protein